MGGGPSSTQQNLQNSEITQQNNIAQQELDLAKNVYGRSLSDTARRDELQQPLIDKQILLAKGDRTSAIQAAMPTISKIAAGYQTSKDRIMNTVPPGPARDTALARLEVESQTGTYGAQAAEIENAPAILAQIGQGVGSFGLQETGAALSGFSGSSSATAQASSQLNQQIEQENEAKANSLGFVSGLAGTAGGLAGKFLKPSDRRLKKNVEPLLNGLDLISRIRVTRYDYVSSEMKRQIGVIAQELFRVLPEACNESADFWAVDYSQLSALSIRGIQEMRLQVATLQEEVSRLSRELADQRSGGSAILHS